MNNNEYTVLDIETTGLSRHRHKITEIAAVKIKGKKIVGEYQTLINPKVPIPKFITRLTGIDNKLVEGAPSINEALPEFLEFIGDSTLVAHNAAFDYGFISHNLKEHLNQDLKNKKLCTRKLANRLLPDLPRKRLGDLCELFKIKNDQAHRAMGDTKATVKIFKKFKTMMELSDVKTHEEILKFENTSPSKIILKTN